MICAMARASLRSVLLGIVFIAHFAGGPDRSYVNFRLRHETADTKGKPCYEAKNVTGAVR